MLVAFFQLFSFCILTESVIWLFLKVPCVAPQCVIMVFPDYTHFLLRASVYMCFVVTCWERADLLALVCGVYCEFVTFPLVSWVRCGT